MNHEAESCCRSMALGADMFSRHVLIIRGAISFLPDGPIRGMRRWTLVNCEPVTTPVRTMQDDASTWKVVTSGHHLTGLT
jgi:hypothetical protein